MIKNEITIPELQDFDGTLQKLSDIIFELKKEYGSDARVRFDAGYNNVDVIIGTV